MPQADQSHHLQGFALPYFRYLRSLFRSFVVNNNWSFLVEYSGLEREGAFYLTSFNTVSGSQSIFMIADNFFPKSLTEWPQW